MKKLVALALVLGVGAAVIDPAADLANIVGSLMRIALGAVAALIAFELGKRRAGWNSTTE